MSVTWPMPMAASVDIAIVGSVSGRAIHAWSANDGRARSPSAAKLLTAKARTDTQEASYRRELVWSPRCATCERSPQSFTVLVGKSSVLLRHVACSRVSACRPNERCQGPFFVGGGPVSSSPPSWARPRHQSDASARRRQRKTAGAKRPAPMVLQFQRPLTAVRS